MRTNADLAVLCLEQEQHIGWFCCLCHQLIQPEQRTLCLVSRLEVTSA